jgi:hypothetical protein
VIDVEVAEVDRARNRIALAWPGAATDWAIA